MQFSRDQRVWMERAHVRAWPALRTADVDGWLWRSSGGGSQRANSVSTIDFHGNDPAAAIREVEAGYRAVGAAARFQTFDETSPSGLADLLHRRGYTQTELTTTMFKRLKHIETVPDVEVQADPWTEWLDVYLSEITENRRSVNARMIDRIPAPRAFFGCRRDGRIVATALGVCGFECTVIECVATRSTSRRQGAARAVLAALESWATACGVDAIGLQVVATNMPAVRLYERLGYVSGAANHFWVSPAQGV
jgi:ribosomal protein S18 acetylase RimI-like enzyme